MTSDELDAALAGARAAVLAARDPATATQRLQRWARRERAFAVSAASLAQDDLIAARAGGCRVQEFAATLRR